MTLGESRCPGMSSTPSISSISQSCRSGAAGAKPTPQFPITTVVTPCQDDGVRYGSHDACRVVVGVDVDPARCQEDVPVGVDDVRSGAAPTSESEVAVDIER